MKTLSELKVTVIGDTFTITGKIIDRSFGFPTQQTTIVDIAKDNRDWARHAQMSQEAFFIRRLGKGVAIPIQDWIQKVANVIEPGLTHAPIFLRKKSTTPLTVSIGSELSPDLQWKEGKLPTDPPEQWTDIPGATGVTLDPKGIEKGKWVICVASSESGQTATIPVQIK